MVQNNTFSTLFIGKPLVYLPSVHSTNTHSLGLLANTKPPIEGTVILADEQTAGRGQQSSVWKSEKGQNLTYSIILYPHFLPVAKQFELTVAFSVGVCKALNSMQIPAVIKWPNDVYVSGKKVGGMLIENQLQGATIKSTVVGMGINVNQLVFANDLRNAISLRQFTGKEYDLMEVLNTLLSYIEGTYLQLKAGQFEVLRKEYLANLYLLNTPTTFKIADGLVVGTICGIGAQGHLQVQIDEEVHEFDLKEIAFS